MNYLLRETDLQPHEICLWCDYRASELYGAAGSMDTYAGPSNCVCVGSSRMARRGEQCAGAGAARRTSPLCHADPVPWG
eukprot:1159166-Pelagomonas_calceolata.AAC.9